MQGVRPVRQHWLWAAVSIGVGALVAVWLLRHAQHVPLGRPSSGGWLGWSTAEPLALLGAGCVIAAALIFVWARAHRRVCPHCGARLLLQRRAEDPAQTDAICPWGHGRLVVRHQGSHARARWQRYGDFWDEMRRAQHNADAAASQINAIR